MRSQPTSPLIFYKCMPPDYLKKKVIGVETTGSDDTELAIGKDSQNMEIFLRDKLLPEFLLSRHEDITVTINVAAEGPKPSYYDPMSIMIGDTETVMGVQLRDPSEYHTIGPYQGIAGDDGRQLTNITYLKSTEKEIDYARERWQRWPQMFRIKLKPSSYWGLCSSAANGGISLSYSYPKALSLNNGLELVLFRNKSSEMYTINMIEVFIHKDS